MRYWDASALVPVLVNESGTSVVQPLFEADPEIVTWAWSVVEITGAIERRVRDGALDRRSRRLILDRLAEFSAGWDEVVDVVAVRRRARALLARHSLRAADAGQLGAAQVVADVAGTDIPFVCLDERLAHAAELEGLRVLPALDE